MYLFILQTEVAKTAQLKVTQFMLLVKNKSTLLYLQDLIGCFLDCPHDPSFTVALSPRAHSPSRTASVNLIFFVWRHFHFCLMQILSTLLYESSIVWDASLSSWPSRVFWYPPTLSKIGYSRSLIVAFRYLFLHNAHGDSAK